MPRLIEHATVVQAAGNTPKRIEEYVGRVNSAHSQVSVARMVSPSGWREPGQRPDFEEITVVLRGSVRVEYEGGVLDGGFAQFFLNSSGDHAAATPAALRAIGAPEMARIVEAALAPFGPAGPSSDQATRQDQRDSLGEAAEEVWSGCDSKFYEYPENLALLLRRFVAVRQNEFGPPIPPDPEQFQ